MAKIGNVGKTAKEKRENGKWQTGNGKGEIFLNWQWIKWDCATVFTSAFPGCRQYDTNLSTGTLFCRLRARVISSAYSSSPPKAIPLAMVVMFSECGCNFF